MESEQQYCISAKERDSKYTTDISGPMSLKEAQAWKPVTFHKLHYTYFRVSKYPFKRHKK